MASENVEIHSAREALLKLTLNQNYLPTFSSSGIFFSFRARAFDSPMSVDSLSCAIQQ